MRMLMNNLDPDVAERPEDLVVYGGTGRAARSWEAYDAIVRTLRTLEEDETLLVQSGKPVGVMRTHEWAPRVLIANSNLVPEWATWEEFRRLEELGLTMYGQMTAGSWIYIGTQGIVQGTYECFAEIARRRHGGSLAGHDHADRRARRHGRGAAAGGDDERRRGPVRGGRPPPDPAPARDALPRRGRRRPRRRRGALPRGEAGAARGQRRPARQRGRRGRDARRPRLRGRHRHRPDERARPAERLRARPDHAGGGRPAARGRSRGVPAPLARRDRRPLRGDGRLPRPRRRGLRLRQQPARRGAARRLRAGLRLPGLRAGVRAAAVLRGQGPVPLGGALGRSRRHRGDRPRRARRVPRRRAPPPLDQARRASGSPSRGCPRGSAGSATASATGSGCGSTRWSATASSRRRS